MQISDLAEFNVNQENFTMGIQKTVADAVDAMSTRHIGAIPIFENDNLVGIFSERDLSTRVLVNNLDMGETKLSEVMTKDPETITPETSVAESIEKMIKGRYRHSLVVDKNNKLIQVLSQRVFVANNWFMTLLEKQSIYVTSKTTLKNIMQSHGKEAPIFLSSKDFVIDVIKLIAEKSLGAVPVIDNDDLVGIITERDIMIKLAHNKLNANTTPISEIMTKNPNTVKNTALVGDCIQSMALGKYRHILVVNDSGKLTKIMSQRDFLSLHA